MICGVFSVAVGRGVGVSLPDGVGQGVCVGVGAGTRIVCPWLNSTMHSGPPYCKPNSQSANSISGFNSESVLASVWYCRAITIMFSPDTTVCHISPGSSVAVGVGAKGSNESNDNASDLELSSKRAAESTAGAVGACGLKVGLGQGTTISWPIRIVVSSTMPLMATTVGMISRLLCPHLTIMPISESPADTRRMQGRGVGVIVGATVSVGIGVNVAEGGPSVTVGKSGRPEVATIVAAMPDAASWFVARRIIETANVMHTANKIATVARESKRPRSPTVASNRSVSP